MTTLKTARELIKSRQFKEAYDALSEIIRRNKYPKTLLLEAQSLLEELTRKAPFNDAQDPTIEELQFKKVSCKPYTATIISWDVNHNCIGRAFILYQLAQKIYENAVLCGYDFPRFGEGIWEPLRSYSTEIITMPEPHTASSLFDYCEEISSKVKTDLVIACKTRLPSILLGLYIKRANNCPLVVDIDDYDLGFLSDIETKQFRQLSSLDFSREASRRMPENPASAFWTYFANNLISHADSVIVSNTSLQRIYGGTIIPHVRNTDPTSTSIAKLPDTHVLTSLGVGNTVIGFVGTPRRHKGVIELAKLAAEETTSHSIKVVFIGQFTDEKLLSDVHNASNGKAICLDNIPFSDIHTYLQYVDIVLLLQDTYGLASKFQLPAKAIDALQLGKSILASPSEPIQMLIDMGFKGITIIDNRISLGKNVDKCLMSSALSIEDRKYNEQLFEANLSYNSGAISLKNAIDSAAKVGTIMNHKNYLHPIGRTIGLSHNSRSSTKEKSHYDHNSNTKSGKKFLHIFLWKQNDFGLFGRRIDMIVQQIKMLRSTDHVLVFEKPVTTYDLGLLRESNNSHHHLIYKSIISKSYGLVDGPRVNVFAPILPKGLSKEERLSFVKNFISEKTSDYYIEYNGNAEINTILWIYPYYENAENIADLLRPSKLVVDIVDDHTKWPGISSEHASRFSLQYKALLDKCDYSLYNCRQNMSTIGHYAQSVKYYIPNGIDKEVSLVKKASLSSLRISGLSDSQSKLAKVIGYSGNLESKIDWELINKISSEFKECLIILIGSTHRITQDVQAENILYTGPIPYHDMKPILGVFDIAIIPHLSTDLTATMNPLKLYVYSALSIPIISTDIPNLPDPTELPCLTIAANHQSFLTTIRKKLYENVDFQASSNLDFVNKNSWEARMKEFFSELQLE